MIKRIDLQHFKCFELLKLDLQPLTLLSGGNASGKSSVLQMLVLLHQTMRESEWSSRLMLNGATIQLGTAADVIDQVYGRREFSLNLTYGDSLYSWTFAGERTRNLAMDVTRVAIDGTDHTNGQLRNLLPLLHAKCEMARCLRRLTYLSAERLGPSETYPLVDPQDDQVVGSRGQHAVSVLYSNADSTLSGDLVIPDAPPTLLPQVQERMERFFPGCRLVVDRLPGTNAATLGIRTSANTGFHRPVHTGFGLTQIFPIIVAALSADPGDLLLIENPEVHLHPAGQSAMGDFLATVAATGVQVVIETHSDHLLNGMRRAVQVEKLYHRNVAIHFFRPREETDDLGSQVVSPTLGANGYLDYWPNGFFDQADRDLSLLIGWNARASSGQ